MPAMGKITPKHGFKSIFLECAFVYGESVQPLNDCTQTKIRRTKKNKKAPDGNQVHIKIIQGNYNMKNKKEQWKPQIINIMADGSQVDDLTGYIIPAGHSYYDIILGMNKQSNEEGVA